MNAILRSIMYVCCVAMIACQSDKCLRLCTRLSNELGSCQQDWNTEWQYLDASSRSSFDESCQILWTEQSSQLEWRERVEAEDQCDAVLEEFNLGSFDCDVLRTLFFYAPQP